MGQVLTLDELDRLAYELGIPPPDHLPSPYRMTNKRAPADSLKMVTAIVGDYGGETRAAPDPSASVRELRRLAETGEVSAHELRGQLRAIGIDLGHQREDAEDLERTARHEAGHAVAGHGLGWTVEFCDARSGQTKVSQPPDYWEQRISDRLMQHAVIAAAGSAACDTSSRRDENENDRVAVRLKGYTDFETARATAKKVLADRWAKPALERLTRALVMVGRLEGDALLRVLEAE